MKLVQVNLFLFLLINSLVFAQGGFTKGTKGNDYIIVTNDGIHFSIGPTYMFPSKTQRGILSDNSGARGAYEIDPAGKLGFFAEIGLAHFPKWKGTPVKFLKKSRIMDYIDWGVGFRQYGGHEYTRVDLTNALGEIVQTNEGEGNFRNNYLYARVSAHTLIYYGKKKIDKVRKHFIDQYIGFNFDYNLISGDRVYENSYAQFPIAHNFQKNLMVQFHYGIGVGIRLNRAWMLIPGVSAPLVGIYQWNGFHPKINWFASNYWPVQAQIKVLKLFERPPKCGVYGDPKDRELDRQFRMGS
jgi:hypothetical protein